MEPQRFDDLAKSMAHGLSRRRMFAYLGGGLAGLLGFTGCGGDGDDPKPTPTRHPRDTLTAPRNVIRDDTQDDQCLAGEKRCDGGCFDLQTNPANCGACGQSCGSDICEGGVCHSEDTDTEECPEGQQRCGDVCVDLQTNPANCGACGQSCRSDACRGGVCTPPLSTPTPEPCPDGEQRCGGGCVDVQNDPANCGACFVACEGTCQDGVCT